MAGLKTTPTRKSVAAFIAAVTPERKREDAMQFDAFMSGATGLDGTMWGDAIVGYGRYHYRYDSGHEGDSFLTGFSPRKQNISVYIMPGFKPFGELLDKLGKHKVSKGSCLYINKLADVDMDVLEELVCQSVDWMKKKYGV